MTFGTIITVMNFLAQTEVLTEMIIAQSVLLFSGALTLLALFVLMIFFRTKDRIYFFYFLFLIFSVVEAMLYAKNFIAFNPVFKLFGKFSPHFLEFFTLAAFGAYCFFTIRLLELEKKSRFLNLLIYWLGVCSLIYGFGYVLFRPETTEGKMISFFISRSVILVGCAVVLFGIVRKIKSPLKKYFLLGTTWYFLGALIAVIRDAFPDIGIPGFQLYKSELYFHWGIYLEVISFTLALFYRIYFHYKEINRNQIKANALAVYEKEQAQAESFSLKIQINPHFLFNYLNVLKYYIQINENKKAIDYLVKFGKLIRGVTDFSDQKIISLEQELKTTKQYLDLEKIRYNDNFEYEIITDNRVILNEIMIPPMLLQPFIEEILWESRQNENSEPQKIDVDIKKSENGVNITVFGSERSSGTKFRRDINKEINQKRINLFNKYYRSKISIEQPDSNSENKTEKRSRITIKIDNFQTE